MSSNPPPDSKPHVSDTKQAAPRKLMLWIVPLAIAALLVLLIGMHFLGGTK